MPWWEFGENQPKLCHQPPLLLEQVLLVVTASGSAQKWTSVFWNQGELSLTPQQQQVFPGAKFLLQPGTPETLPSSAKFWTKYWENRACCFPRYKLNLAKFQPGSQRGLRLPLLLLVVVEDGRHVLPVGRHGGHDDHHESGQHDGHDVGTDRDLEQAFAEFGSWFCQKKTRSLAKVTTLGSYSTCARLDMKTVK